LHDDTLIAQAYDKIADFLIDPGIIEEGGWPYELAHQWHAGELRNVLF
jgi:hypothetical protein